MSNYYKQTKNPRTGKWEKAMWCDDHFGPHHYGVIFPSNEQFVFDDPEIVKLETRDSLPSSPQEAHLPPDFGKMADGSEFEENWEKEWHINYKAILVEKFLKLGIPAKKIPEILDSIDKIFNHLLSIHSIKVGRQRLIAMAKEEGALEERHNNYNNLFSQLQSFNQYCVEHPTERFWQALRNWSGYAFIIGAVQLPKSLFPWGEDTFYK